MAGDSEQTLQNHQQPNGGEPFLIGVSGGTASGKVRGPRALPARRAAHVAGARGPWQLQPATAWPARSSLPDAALRRRQPRAGSGRGVGDRRGTGTIEGPGCGSPLPSPQGWCALSPVPRGGWDSWSGSCGGGAKSGCLLFCKSGMRMGLLGSPRPLLRLGLALAGRPNPRAARVAGMREVARRLPGAHLGGAELSGREPSSVGAVADGMTAGVAVFYSWKRKRDQS